MEIDSKYHVELAQLDGTARRETPQELAMPVWLAQVTAPGAPGYRGRFTGDTAYDVARQAAEYIQELEKTN